MSFITYEALLTLFKQLHHKTQVVMISNNAIILIFLYHYGMYQIDLFIKD